MRFWIAGESPLGGSGFVEPEKRDGGEAGGVSEGAVATREGGSAPGARRIQTEDAEAEGRETSSSCSEELLRPPSP
ncbi:uncharacterized protein LOC101832679 isoform X3 [Mesocricetus auratus]|uniref:Uncharacterized protein LOC101832679 isoform X3 n=1 Tax=Mesocricetus auratus TaxID=10036 RepID=A0ABM2W7U3_MESAU|nr:uncharacterized protein LOC101832679 isoform X3 [Mesocricetus auratus]